MSRCRPPTPSLEAPLTFAQESSRAARPGAVGRVPYITTSVVGGLRVDVLHATLTEVVRVHDALRLDVSLTPGSPRQRLVPMPELGG